MTERKPTHLGGVVCWKYAPNGQLVTVVPLTFNRARINLGEPSGAFYDSGW